MYDWPAGPLTWDAVAERLKLLPRGATAQLAAHIDIDNSFLNRKLKTTGELTERQAALVRSFRHSDHSKLLDDGERSFQPRQAPSARELPVYGHAAAADGDRIAFNEGSIVEFFQLPHGLALGPGEYFVVRPIGSSMEPRVFSDEFLIVRKDYPPTRNKEVVVEFKDGTALIKTYQGSKDGRINVKQWNAEKGLDFDATEVKALHAVAFKL